jgi:uncharacterized protein (DUF697 family)
VDLVNLAGEGLIMSSFQQGLWSVRRSGVGQWAGGTIRALAAIGLSALLVWIAVCVINDSGLLTPAPAQQHSPAGGSPFAQRAYG